ncbi:MAG: flagellar assembly protein FliW [Anaerovibrio sp.]|uniref:Flagellar assembly factor FliW n=2 Tax=Anaerovibrio slackiae TaxID=2652309 RepID=A0A6I2UDR4_9FIRM|nr:MULTISPECIES: flagellar assembly protein FliW [Anaerovibrio]MBQ2410218.1 flagellar assembly protein FliW [Selenomonadaceae bacterium]MDD6163758.1 flagellar assembly protein FliW [Anaerovibrio slackiae]MEE1306878.1 flagellar assembly protein FliW [Anaerovibrio sp.]MSU07830.1 flagellar assembly protein FliW [Anaerovibrio slackiae]
MKKINTLRFGELEIEEQDVVRFADGIPAFEDEHEFVVLPYEEGTPYMFLQSMATPELAFLMTDPFVFFPDYSFELDDENMDKLEIKTMDDVLVCTLISIPRSGVADMTTNLLAPVVINRHTMQAKQIVLEKTQYTTKHRLFPEKKGDK